MFFVCSGVPAGIGVLVFLGDLYAPLVRFLCMLRLPPGYGIHMFWGNLDSAVVRLLYILVNLMASAH